MNSRFHHVRSLLFRCCREEKASSEVRLPSMMTSYHSSSVLLPSFYSPDWDMELVVFPRLSCPCRRNFILVVLESSVLNFTSSSSPGKCLLRSSTVGSFIWLPGQLDGWWSVVAHLPTISTQWGKSRHWVFWSFEPDLENWDLWKYTSRRMRCGL